MARTQQKKSLWTPEEDDKLKEFRHKYPNLSWPAIAKQAELNRTGKSCWESWENNLNPDINKGEFSPQEDELIIPLKSAGVSWASMAKNDLRGRAPNAIKNRWNNHLKKRHAIISDLRRHLLYLEEHLMDDKASDYSVRGGDLKALMAEFASLIPNVDPNETSDHSIRGDDLEALMAKFASLIPNVDPNESSDHSIREDDLEALMAKFASLIPNVDANETSDHSIRLKVTFSAGVTATTGFRVPNGGRAHGGLTSSSALMLPQNPVAGDICAAALTGGTVLSLIQFWGGIAKRGFTGQTVSRKFVHISVGLVFMLFWPLFSSGCRGALLAALIPGVNIIRMLLLGLGIWKDEAVVKSMSRYGDHRELLKGPLCYALAITLACAIYWRTSPIAIAAICNLCAGDGLADLVGRRFGIQKIPYNRNKSFSGSLAMAVAGFLASIGYMHYFASFGFIQESWEMVFGFLVVSLGSTLVESLPISNEIDDNLTIPVTSLLLGTLVF